MKKLFSCMVLLLLATTGLLAQTDTTAKLDDDALSLEDLMKVKITVASRNEQTLRETPAVVTIVTGEEIRNSGARDLIDVLRLVPGFDFGHDLEGVVGIGIRGNWAQEAKVLLQIDGIDMMETSYGSLQLADHYPITNIERIEIIRGPGSVIYGGNASLAVINIITRSPKNINGIGVNATYGQMQNTFARRNFALFAGLEVNKDFSYKITVNGGQSNMSDRLVNYPGMGAVNYADSSRINPFMVNAAVKYKGLEVNYIFDNYQLQSTLISNSYLFLSNNLNVKYNFKISDKISATVRASTKNQLPWFYLDKADTAFYNTNIRTDRHTGAVQAVYKPIDKLEIIGGVEYFYDHAKLHTGSSAYRFVNGKKEIGYHNTAVYVQGQYNSKLVNITAGVRMDKHNRFGYVILPRAALTKTIGAFYAKIMYSWAYRAPTIFNLDVNPDIDPEMATVSEAEIGVSITPEMIFTVNVFDNKVRNPIIYTYINDIENYFNDQRSGTRGVEVEYKYKTNGGYFTANYSLYQAHKQRVDAFRVPGHSGLTLAFPAHKVTINGSIKIIKGLSINPVAVFYSARYGFNNNQQLFKVNPTALLSTYINYDDVIPNLSIGVGVYDILGQNYQFIQAYRSYYNALPGPSREFLIRLRYKFSFNN